MKSTITSDVGDERLVTRSLMGAREALGLTLAQTGAIIGVSESTMKRYSLGNAVISAPKVMELALGLIRIYQALFAVVGGDLAQMRHWMTTPNRHFRNGQPDELAQTYQGLAELNVYLDAMPGRH